MFEVEEASTVFSRALNLFSFERMKWGKNRALKQFLKVLSTRVYWPFRVHFIPNNELVD